MPLVLKSTTPTPSAPKPISQETRRAAAAAVASQKKDAVRTLRVRGAGKIVAKELAPFSRQLAAMLNAGMPLLASLQTLEEQTVSPGFRSVLIEVRKQIEGGSTFSDALLAFPAIFSDLYVNMVRAGERSGQFAESMRSVGELLEASARLRRKVKSAMTYPIVVMAMALIIALGMITFIVPVFAQMFADFGRALPAPTQFLVDTSHFMRRYGLFLLAGIGVLVWVFRRWKSTDQGAYRMDAIYLRAPVFGLLVQKVAISRMARTLGQLVRSGVPILTALEIVSKATGNRVIGEAVMKSRNSVERGDTITKGLEESPHIPVLVVRMMAAGEKSGKLDEMLANIAATYDDEVEAMLASLTSLLEPLLMVFLGVTIGGIVISMFLPIFKMSEVVSGR